MPTCLSRPDKPEIVLPRTDRLGRLRRRRLKADRRVLKANRTGRIAVYKDLAGADRDIVRVRTADADDDGSVSAGRRRQNCLGGAGDVAGGCLRSRNAATALSRRANREANEYMQRVRLGQTEHGSFVVTLLAPVPPLLQPQLDPSWARFEDEPLERRVTRRLVIAPLRLHGPCCRTRLVWRPGAFERAVAQGVSANLCEAVANLIDQSSGVDISVTWARTRPTTRGTAEVSLFWQRCGTS